MAGRWTPAAHHVLSQAGVEARQLGHDYVGTEHGLLGLLDVRDEFAAHVLTDLGATREGLPAQRRAGPYDPRPFDSPCVMPRFKQALEHARRIADGLGQSVASSEHMRPASSPSPMRSPSRRSTPWA